MDRREPVVRRRVLAALAEATLAQAVAVSNPGPVVDDDAFLSEIEAAIAGSHNQELLPFDALTPRVQEIGRRLP